MASLLDSTPQISQCCYPCSSGFPVILLEQCATPNCKTKLHHMCQALLHYEHQKKIQHHVLTKKCHYCLLQEVRNAGEIIHHDSDISYSNEKQSLSSFDSIRETSSITPIPTSTQVTTLLPITENKTQTPNGKIIRQLIIDQDSIINKTKYQSQRFANKSLLLCLELYFYNNRDLLSKHRNEFTELFGPYTYTYGKIVQVPRKKKHRDIYNSIHVKTNISQLISLQKK